MKASINFIPPVIAHRGASAYAPENTMASFVKAAQLGIRWIEFDVMPAACGTPIIFHDDELDRTTNGHGEANQFPYPYLASLDAGSWFNMRFANERIPTLASVLSLLNDVPLSANVEIKPVPGQEKKFIPRVVDEIRSSISLTEGRILFSSFSIDALRCLRQYAPDCLIGLLLHEWEPDWQAIGNSLNCVSIHVNHEIMTPAAAYRIKSMGKALLCYTVNQPARAHELFSWGVDAVFSDVPDKITALECSMSRVSARGVR